MWENSMGSCLLETANSNRQCVNVRIWIPEIFQKLPEQIMDVQIVTTYFISASFIITFADVVGHRVHILYGQLLKL